MLETCKKCNKKKQFPKEFHRGYQRKDGSYYYISCKECYNKYQNQYNLKIGKTQTTHNLPKNNLLGQKFGLLTVIEYSGKKQLKNRKRHVWLCNCNCGNQKIILDHSLKCGKTRSCGCLSKSSGKNSALYTGFEDISGKVWSKIKSGAKSRNLEFSISVKYAWNLFLEQNRQCSLTGRDLVFAETSEKQDSGHTTASLDRIDSALGYTENNIQWVHKDINQMKWTLSQEDFILLCKEVSNYNIS